MDRCHPRWCSASTSPALLASLFHGRWRLCSRGPAGGISPPRQLHLRLLPRALPSHPHPGLSWDSQFLQLCPQGQHGTLWFLMAEAGALPRRCLAGGPCPLQTHIREWCLQGSRKWPRPPGNVQPSPGPREERLPGLGMGGNSGVVFGRGHPQQQLRRAEVSCEETGWGHLPGALPLRTGPWVSPVSSRPGLLQPPNVLARPPTMWVSQPVRVPGSGRPMKWQRPCSVFAMPPLLGGRPLEFLLRSPPSRILAQVCPPSARCFSAVSTHTSVSLQRASPPGSPELRVRGADGWACAHTFAVNLAADTRNAVRVRCVHVCLPCGGPGPGVPPLRDAGVQSVDTHRTLWADGGPHLLPPVSSNPPPGSSCLSSPEHSVKSRFISQGRQEAGGGEQVMRGSHVWPR